MTAWKRFEDSVCMALGGRRQLGNLGGAVPDCDERVLFSVESKKGYASFRLSAVWIAQARRNALPGKPWLIVQAPKHCRVPLVTLEFPEFVRIAALAGLIPSNPTMEGITGENQDTV